MYPTVEEMALLVAERDAVMRPIERLLRCRNVPEGEIPVRMMHICLALGAESWRRAQPILDEEQAAQLFSEMAAEAVRAFNDAMVIMASRRTLKGGETNHA